MKNKSTPIWPVIVTAIAILGLSACAPPVPAASTPANAGASQPDPGRRVIRINDFPFLSQAPLQIAADEGYLAAQGLEVEWIPGSRTEDVLPSLLTGDMDVVGTAPSVGVFSALERGGRLKIVADKGVFDPDGCVYGGLVAAPGLLTDGGSPEAGQVSGKRIAANPVGLSGYFLATWLASLGMSLDDVEIINVPIPTAFESLVSGATDYAFLTEPWLTRALQIDGATLAVPVASVTPGLNIGLIFYGPSLLDQEQELGIRFMKAYRQAVDQYLEGKTPENIAIISKYTQLEPALIEAACWPAIRPDLTVDLAALQGFADWSFASEGAGEAPDVGQAWEPSYLSAAEGPSE